MYTKPKNSHSMIISTILFSGIDPRDNNGGAHTARRTL